MSFIGFAQSVSIICENNRIRMTGIANRTLFVLGLSLIRLVPRCIDDDGEERVEGVLLDFIRVKSKGSGIILSYGPVKMAIATLLPPLARPPSSLISFWRTCH
ncbi:MAG: hypothetical protein EA402_03250 [Planctomycetota bacterium]|nr:MAG: hypothetical protein EA402_03250 [Planctomycetota bacterium]